MAVLALVALLPLASRAERVGTQEFVQLQPVGTGTLTSGGIGEVPATSPQLEVRHFDLEDLTAETAGSPGVAQSTAPTEFPTARNLEFTLLNRGFFGFDGLNHRDQRFAGTGRFANTQFSLEPPDQGLCVGNGFVLETINTVLAVFRASDGTRLAGPTALNQFFGLTPEVIRSDPPVFGDFTSDPRCLFDAATNRFFVVLLQIDVDAKTGDFGKHSSLLLAVSQTGDPTRQWNFFRLDVTNDGSARCPCFGDQPLMGADSNGLFLSTNAFSLAFGRFRGTQIYAMSKLFLAAGRPPPFVLHIALSPAVNPDGGRDSSVQPASSARAQAPRANGTEFFLSSFNTRVLLNNRVVAWALRNTALLNSPPGPRTRFSLFKTVVRSEVYGVPPDARQKPGALPLGDVRAPGILELLATNEHRMQQVTLADDKLWAAVTTGLLAPGEVNSSSDEGLKAGIAFFAVKVKAEDDELKAKVDRQGYLAVRDANLFFPAVGINGEGQAAIGFSFSGPAFFPSTGYVQLDEDGRPGKIHVAGGGVAPEDGFSGYPVPGFDPCLRDDKGKIIFCEARWGDYGAAAVTPDGTIWLANEYIGPRPRTLFANWGTFVTRIRPNGEEDDD